jgi:hypothetical protein
MTILVAYVARPEGQAALEKGMEIAKRRNERLMVVNASPGGTKEDPSMVDTQERERVEKSAGCRPHAESTPFAARVPSRK